MTNGHRPVGEDDLTAYLDGELPAERRALVEAWLAERPEAQARMAQDREIAARLRAGLAPLADAPAPDHLRLAAIRDRMRARRAAGARRAAAAAALVAIGVGAGWGLNDAVRGAGPGDGAGREVASFAGVGQGDIRAAVAAHRIFVAEKAHAVEVAAGARDHLGAWLGNRLGAPVAIPDLSAAGLTLMGGRLLPGPRGPAGQLMYHDSDGARVTLYIQQGPGGRSNPDAQESRRFLFASLDGDEALAWRSPTLSYVLAGPFSRDRLIGIAHLIHDGAAPI